MKTGIDLLREGIDLLRQKDAEIDRLISPRSEECLSLLDRYVKEIELFNEAYGLVGASGEEELIIKHILDSLSPLGIISRLLAELCAKNSGAPQIADAGSGAGLPGIPLAIALPMCGLTLIERMGRRAGFLWNTKAALNLSNVTVEEGEVEKTAAKRFNLITFRAFKPLEPKLLKTLSAACAQGGAIAAYKGRREKIEQEISSSAPSAEIIPYSVPFLEDERHLVVIRDLLF